MLLMLEMVAFFLLVTSISLSSLSRGIILTWAVVLSAIFFAMMIAFRSLMPSVFLHLTAAIGGCFTGLLATLRVSQPHPLIHTCT